MHLNNLIKSSDEYNQTYLVVGKCYAHFVLERFIFQPVVTVRLASLRQSLVFYATTLKELLHGIDNGNGQSGLIFDLWSYKWFTKAQDSKLVVGFVNYMHKYRENSITHCKESFFCYCLQKCAFTLSRKTCDWNAAATWYFIFLLELNALTPKITISIFLKVCCTSIIVSALRMWNKIVQFPFADI